MSSIELIRPDGAEARKINIITRWMDFRQEQLDPHLRRHLPNLAVLAMPCLAIIGAVSGEKIWPVTVPIFLLVLAARAGHQPPKSVS